MTKGLFKITPGLRIHHNYRLDTAFTGRYLTRREDGSLDFLDRVQSEGTTARKGPGHITPGRHPSIHS
ncbi:MAG: hypothetical protein QNJ40_10765 [Xanthomonadales bacterium]|nr:hypothetical protein [Xanthomonadales bacterium]